MKTLKEFLEARMIATGDFKISASGRKVRRLIKVGDDAYNKADDLDKDGDVDKDDRRLAKEEVEQIEEATVKSANYSWGTMKTVHHGKDFSIPLHPEHHKPIAALKHGESHSFKDETGSKWKATREDDTVHFHGGSYGTQKTSVKHDTMKESYINEQHLVHVNDGSKYNEEPHDKDVEHVMSGAKTHKGEFDSHTDKGAIFKFKDRSDADNFKRHVDKCPKRTCSADHLNESTEQINEASDKQDSRLLQLARLGLLDKNDVAIFRNAMQTFKADKQLSIKQRNMLLSVYNDLVNMVTGDDAMFARAKLDIQKEEAQSEGYYKDIDTNAKEDERLSGSWKKETPWRKIKPDSNIVTDKSGAKHTPMSRARHLARMALKKTDTK